MRRAVLVFLCSFSLLAQTAAPGTINTIAGNGYEYPGDNDPLALHAKFDGLSSIASDRAGNLYIAEGGSSRIRRIATNGTIYTFAGIGGGIGYGGDGGPAALATFQNPQGIAVDITGNVYIADTGNHRIRKIDLAGNITTIAGTGTQGFSGDEGPAINATLNNPVYLGFDLQGNLLVVDQGNQRVRRISSSGIIGTIAGNGTITPADNSFSSPGGAFSGDGGPATAAALNNPAAVAVSPAGALYISDRGNNRIRKIGADGTIVTIAGDGVAGFGGDNGPASAARLNLPSGLAFDTAGNLYFNDEANFRTRRIDGGGTITTIAGTGVQGYAGDGGPAAAATLSAPFGMCFDPAGNLYIGDGPLREVYGVEAPGPRPGLSSGGIAPLFSPGSPIQAGSWISIYGANFANGTYTWNNDFPTILGNASVTINNKPAYLWYVSPTQINAQAPDDMTTGTVNVVVSTPTGSATTTTVLASVAPSFSLLDSKHVAGIILRSDGSGAYGGGTYDIVGPTGTSFGYKTVAAKAGDVVELFGVGFGPTNPNVPAGKPLAGSAATTNPVQVFINGTSVPPTFAGLTSPGLYQINLVNIPAGLGTGDVTLRATVAGVQTRAGIVISLQ